MNILMFFGQQADNEHCIHGIYTILFMIIWRLHSAGESRKNDFVFIYDDSLCIRYCC